jgi:hypothetical protein
MLCSKMKKLRLFICCLLAALVITTATSCVVLKATGTIVILEEPGGKMFTIDFNEWTSSDECKMSLKEGDVLQFDVTQEEGEIALNLSGKNGSEPFTGNGLNLGAFTVTVQETDDYTLKITGKKATGKIILKIVEDVE